MLGLGGADQADILRLLWPTGVPQDEIDIAAGKAPGADGVGPSRQFLPDAVRLGRQQFGFVSDVIGAGVVGHWTSPVERNIPDPDEWIKIDGAD